MVAEEYYEDEYEEEEEGYEDDEEFVEQADFLPKEYARPKSDVWTMLLILGFLFILSAMVIMCIELNDVYQVPPEKIIPKLFG